MAKTWIKALSPRVFGGVAVIMTAALLIAVVARGGAAPTPSAGEADPAPEVSFQTFDGETVTLAQFRGKPVVLNFFASWCPTCVAEMPDFEAVHAKLGERVTFVGLALQDDPTLAQALRAQTGVTYQTFQDLSGAAYRAFEGFAMPTTIFIDADGNVVGQHSGILLAENLEDKISELLLGP